MDVGAPGASALKVPETVPITSFSGRRGGSPQWRPTALNASVVVVRCIFCGLLGLLVSVERRDVALPQTGRPSTPTESAIVASNANLDYLGGLNIRYGQASTVRRRLPSREIYRWKLVLRRRNSWPANGKMRTCGMPAYSLGLVGLGFRVRDKVRVSVRNRVGVRVSDGVRVSTF